MWPFTKAKSASSAFMGAISRESAGISRGSTPRPYSDEKALQTFHSFGYAAAVLNATAFASTAKRLYARADSRATKGFATRPITKSLARHFGNVSSSRVVRRKFVQFGGDVVEVVERIRC